MTQHLLENRKLKWWETLFCKLGFHQWQKFSSVAKQTMWGYNLRDGCYERFCTRCGYIQQRETKQ